MRRTARLAMVVSLLGLGLVVAFGAAAQPSRPAIPDAVVRKMIELGLKNIDRALCDGFNQCKAATPAEYEKPPITIENARVAVATGVRSAFARWCGFDADRRSVGPLLQQLRQGRQFNERQVALMAVIHGIQQSITSDQLKAQGECDAATRSRIDAQLPKS
jgi:hypothetical protein